MIDPWEEHKVLDLFISMPPFPEHKPCEMRIVEEREALDETTRHTLQQRLHSPINQACAIKESVLK